MKEQLIEIGYTQKVSGLKGLLKVIIKNPFEADFKKSKVLFLDIKGKKLPFFVEKIETKPSLSVLLEEVDSREKANNLIGKTISLREKDLIPDDQRIVSEEELGLHLLKGFQMVDIELGLIGEIVDIEEFPQQIMAFVDYQGKEIMIPLNEQFIKGIDPKKRIVQVDLPEGLLDM